MAANMLAVLIILIFRICHSEGATVTAAYSNNDVFSCFPGRPNAIDVTLTCKVTITFSGSVVWSRDATEMKTCSSSSGICVNSIGFSEQRYSFTADLNKKEFYLTITSVNSTIDLATFKCEHGTGDIGTFTIRECLDCTVPSVTNGQTNATSATVAEGTLVVITCDAGYTLEGSSELICQADQTWDNPFPTCTGTTTTTTTSTSTSTTTPPTTTITSTTTTTPTKTIPRTTTTTSTTTTSTTTTTPSTTARSTTKSSSTTPSTSTGHINTPSPTSATTSPAGGESNTSLIAMIVVVSVIGGILVIAIVFLVLMMVYEKSGLPLSTHRKGIHHRPAVDKHHHHRHHKHHKRRERSEHCFYQPQNVLAGYSFYRGGVDNPVFQESMDYPNTQVLHYKDANEGFHAPRYDEQPPEYQYAVNWEYGVD